MLPEAVIFILLFINLTVSEVILTKPEDIHSKDLPEHIALGMMFINMRKEPTISRKFKEDIDMMMESMLSWSSGTPLHFIVITDGRSVRGHFLSNLTFHFLYLILFTEAEKVLRDTISKCVSLGVIRKKRTKRKYRIPNVKMTFVDIKDITEGNEEFINAMKSNTDKGILSSEFNEKYFHDLFYLGPVYHNKFINLEKFIFLDVDLVFQTDIKKLENQFSKFDLPGGSCIGVGPDLSPHYLHKLKEFRKENPGTVFGDPGRFQGFNTGVTLYHLECLRNNAVYNEYLQQDKVRFYIIKT